MEQLKLRLLSLKEKITDVEYSLNSNYDANRLETELQSLEEELDNFRFYLEERLY